MRRFLWYVQFYADGTPCKWGVAPGESADQLYLEKDGCSGGTALAFSREEAVRMIRDRVEALRLQRALERGRDDRLAEQCCRW